MQYILNMNKERLKADKFRLLTVFGNFYIDRDPNPDVVTEVSKN